MKASLARLNPRLSLTAAIGWVLVVVSVGSAYLAALSLGSLARDRLERQTGALFKQYALQISNELDIALYVRQSWIGAVGTAVSAEFGQQDTARLRRVLEELQASLPELEWIGLTDGGGVVRVATRGHLERESMADEPWFVEGAKRAWIGDVRDAPRLNKLLHPVSDGAHRFISIAAPMVPVGQQRGIGVIGSHLSWSWAEQLEQLLTEALKSGRPVESLLVNRDGAVVLGPKSLLGAKLDFATERAPGEAGQMVLKWPDGQYVSGYAVSDGVGAFPGLGWTVWVREPTATAFADVRNLERDIFVTLLVLGLIAAAVGVQATRRLTRGLSAIARSADEIRLGKMTAVAVPAGGNEAARIGHSLRALVEGLQHEQTALKTLNAELDARIAARTREVERMSEENKHAAVVRERLRMARDLHHTLAHSMTALLTEIRLLRKLADANPGGLKSELANAEEAALAGLREARAAITQLRHDGVRDIGLGASLASLLARYETREGIPVAYERDRRIDALADARAETLYRIVEECLHNIERHAQATRVEAFARTESSASCDTLTLSIADDGVGFDVREPRPGHYGIRGMHEQAALIGAQLEIRSAPGAGTRVIVTMPL